MNKPKISIFDSYISAYEKNSSAPSLLEKDLLDFFKVLSKGGNIYNSFFDKALKSISSEMKDLYIDQKVTKSDNFKNFWKHIFPEGSLFFQEPEEEIKNLRKKRQVTIESLNSDPIENICLEMTFTSNVLLTIPPKEWPLEELSLPDSIKESLPPIMDETQLYWFDHPIPLGQKQESNEILYGLIGLSNTLAYEKAHGKVDKNERLDVLLSVSVTHLGLQDLAAPYLRHEISQCEEIKDLNIYIFTEGDSKKLIKALFTKENKCDQYFGVDGKYGRHYNFLKAINLFWKLGKNEKLKGTFKIDLDQIFPEDVLLKYTGKTAFEHFHSPLWGAQAIDQQGRKVDLSMIAGALVNESDIKSSLFTPDVSLPNLEAPLDDLVFFKHLTMAISTRAELMTRYDNEDGLDGKKKAISRIHVTGGTNGILIDALLKYRPFTPSFIGRAEDQAYLLSVLNDKKEPLLRYYHESGLVMRHDKEAFAADSVKAAKDGTYIADIMRILYYSYYGKILPGGIEAIKKESYPFTGSYISEYPFTLSYLRLACKVLELYKEGSKERAHNMLKLAEERIEPLVEQLTKSNFLKSEYENEKEQWNIFYDRFTELFQRVASGESEALKYRDKISQILENCKVS